jgi:hypothetical protein
MRLLISASKSCSEIDESKKAHLQEIQSNERLVSLQVSIRQLF